jgi:hypothetical protein
VYKKFILLISMILSLYQIQCTLPEPDDITAPTVAIIYPYSESVIADTVNIIIESSDDDEIDKVWVYLDDEMIASRAASSARFSVDVSPYADDLSHLIQGVASDKSGNRGYSSQVMVTISKFKDSTNPTVAIVNPQSGQQVQDTVKVLASADDDRAVSEVAFFVNGDSLATDNTYPYEYQWETTGLADSTSHSIFAKAFDEAGNWAISEAVTVTVFPRGDRTPPTLQLIYPGAGSVISGIVNVAVDAYDNVGVTSVEFYVDGSLEFTDNNFPWDFAWDTSTLPAGSHTLFIKAYDAANNVGTTGNITFTIADDPDITPPTITLLYPASGSVLANSVNVVVDVIDNVGVDSVRFYVDGLYEITDTDEPWGFLWNTASLDSGIHTLYMKAYDPAGNIGTLGPENFIKE